LSGSDLRPAFVDGGRGRILVVARVPAGRARGAVLIAPPFAEEMNKTRKLTSDLAQALAAVGIVSVLPDLFGTGDSEGEFREGDWEVWKADLARTADWAEAQGWPVDRLVGVRLGCALAAEFARDRSGGVRCSVFWQPVADGQRFLTQFLRLRVAASMMSDADRETASGLRERLRAGESLEVAGYELTPALAAQVERVRLTESVGPRLGRLTWLEIVRDVAAVLPQPAEDVIKVAAGTGLPVEAQTVVSEPFWSSTEIVRVPELVRHSVAALECRS
jgi:exosortase A-associated hydrolase 2